MEELYESMYRYNRKFDALYRMLNQKMIKDHEFLYGHHQSVLYGGCSI